MNTAVMLNVLKFLYKYKTTIFILVMLLCITLLINMVGNLKDEKQELRDQHNAYVVKQKLLQEQAKVKAIQQEQLWLKQQHKAKDNYNAKVNELKNNSTNLKRTVDRVSKQISNDRSSIPNATEETLRSYTTTLTNVYEQCVREYKQMAERADNHAIEAQTLSDAFPTSTSSVTQQ